MDRLPLYIIISSNHRDVNLVRIGDDKAVQEAAAPTACKMTFADVLRRDYKNETYGFSRRILSMMAISIDAWELLGTQRPDMTMDTCVGIATHDRSKQYGTIFNSSSHRLLLVEFKLKCKSSTSVRLPDLRKKVRHTRSLFTNHPVDEANIFIFPDGLVSSYRSVLNRFRTGAGKTDYAYWEIMSPKDFNDYIAFEENLPFVPVNKQEDIISDITLAYQNHGVAGLDKSLNRWKTLIMQYKSKYRLQEVDHITMTIKEILQTILHDMSQEDEKGYIEMEYSIFLN